MDNFQLQRTHSSQETQTSAAQLADTLIHSDTTQYPLVICLYGNLGSGKTTFTQGFAKGLGVTERVISPTFLFMREYDLPSRKRLFHLDAYHMPSADKAFHLQELFQDPQAIVLVEWADKITNQLPRQRIDIFFDTEEDESHTIKIVEIK